MKNKIIGTTILLSVCLLLVFFFWFSLDDKTDNNKASQATTSPETIEIKIAACPTYHQLATKLDPKKYQIIKTNSTSASINLLIRGRADMMLAGRTLRPEEPILEMAIIETGYSFLNKNGGTVYVDDLKNYNIYTDLNKEVLKSNFPLEKIEEVADVYDYLDQGIIITSWENTDYNQAEIVHVLEPNGDRVKLSRRPTLYCAGSCTDQAMEKVVSTLQAN